MIIHNSIVIHTQNWSKNLLLWLLYKKITTKSEAKIYFYAFVLCLLLKVMKKCTIRTSFYFHLKSELLWPLYVFATKNEARIYYYDLYVCLLTKSDAKIYFYRFFAWLLRKMKQESTIATSDSKDNFTTATSLYMHVLWKLLH